MKFETGDYLQHKKYGWIGQFHCHDKLRGLCLVGFLDGEDRDMGKIVNSKYNVDFPLMDYAPTITWRGSFSRLEENFEKINIDYSI